MPNFANLCFHCFSHNKRTKHSFLLPALTIAMRCRSSSVASEASLTVVGTSSRISSRKRVRKRWIATLTAVSLMPRTCTASAWDEAAPPSSQGLSTVKNSCFSAYSLSNSDNARAINVNAHSRCRKDTTHRFLTDKMRRVTKKKGWRIPSPYSGSAATSARIF